MPGHTGRKIEPLYQIKPLYLGAARAGFVRPALALARWPAVFRVGEHAVHVHDLAGRVRRVVIDYFK